MLISPPFLPARQNHETDAAWLAHAMTGGAPGDGAFPVSFKLGWHGGMHLTAPMNGAASERVRAIADGEVIFKRDPYESKEQRQRDYKDKNHPQNYVGAKASYGGWTDKGCVVIRHETEIGERNGTAVTVVFYSIYMHLAEIHPAIVENRRVYRKADLGQAGQIEGHTQRQIHFEIVCDDDNMQKLANRKSGDVPTGADGRTDAVFGEIYFHLPAGTVILDRPPTPIHAAATAPPVHTTTQALAVGLRYAGGDGAAGQRGHAYLTTYQLDGDTVGTALVELNAEYNLYQTATNLSNAFPANARPAPSAVYELLRFGRVIGPDALNPVDVPHWRQIRYPGGQGWVNLNAAGVTKFSDADLPQWKGWTLITDDTDTDSRCNSATLKGWIDINNDGKVTPDEAVARLRNPGIADRLAKTVCKFPSEWDIKTIKARWGWLQTVSEENPDPFDGNEFRDFEIHAQALIFDLGKVSGLKGAHWHWHPREFIKHFRKCGWLSSAEIQRVMPGVTEANATRFTQSLNFVIAKYLGRSGVRRSHFLGQVAHETGDLAGPMVERGNSTQSRQYETGATFFAGPDTYSFFQQGAGYERLNNTLGNQYNSGDGIKFRGRGSLQITGRVHYANYWTYRGWLAQSTFQQSWWSSPGWWQVPPNPNIMPAQIANPQNISARAQGNELNPIDVGGWYWVSHGINRECDSENPSVAVAATSDDVSRVINRYDTPTFPARRERVERAKLVLGDAT